jgi:hypothetical protein
MCILDSIYFPLHSVAQIYCLAEEWEPMAAVSIVSNVFPVSCSYMVKAQHGSVWNEKK